MRRLVITSISPTHVNGDIQQRCVSSWVAADIGNVVTMNDPCEDIKVPSGCIRVDAPKSGREVFKAPYVYITDMIDYARKNDYDSVMLINSDIELRDQRKVIKEYLNLCSFGLVISNRYDHSGNYIKGIRYFVGIDVFVVHKNFYHLFSEAPFVMGQTWWDYWLPYRFAVNDLPIFNIKASIFYHKEHHVQYSATDWMRMCEHFISLEGYKSMASKPRRKPAHLRMNRHSNGEPNYGGVSQEVFGIISAKMQMI